MKALTIDDYGIEHVAVRDLPAPEPGPGEVLVAMKAGALNRLDLWTLTGSLGIEHTFPHVLGADGAGEVLSSGPGVSGLPAGTRVLVNPGLSCGACEMCLAGEQPECPRFMMMGEHVPGTFAEQIVVPAGNVFPTPAHLSFAEGAALGTTFVTAYRMLFTKGRMQPGEWILITGIGGGLATSLLQLARPLAGRVFVTSSSDDKLAAAAELGADHGINYTTADVAREVRRLTGKRGVDIVADSAAGESLEGSLKALKKGGRLVNAGATAGGSSTINMQRVFWNQLQIIGSTMGSHHDFSEMLRFVSGTGMRPVIDRSFPLDEGIDALHHLDATERSGKVVLTLD